MHRSLDNLIVFSSASWYTSDSSMIVSGGFFYNHSFEFKTFRDCRENLAIINKIDFNVVFDLNVR